MKAKDGQIIAARILIVDDDEAIREALSQAITLEGIELDIVTARNAAAGLAAAQAATPDVVILDYNMPMENGFELAAKLRSSEQFKATKLIMLTAQDTPGMSWQSFDHNIDAFLGKPFDLGDIEATVYSLLTQTQEKQRQIRP